MDSNRHNPRVDEADDGAAVVGREPTKEEALRQEIKELRREQQEVRDALEAVAEQTGAQGLRDRVRSILGRGGQ